MASSTREKKTKEADTCGRRPGIAVADSVEKTGSVKILRATPMLFQGITCKMQAIGRYVALVATWKCYENARNTGNAAWRLAGEQRRQKKNTCGRRPNFVKMLH